MTPPGEASATAWPAEHYGLPRLARLPRDERLDNLGRGFLPLLHDAEVAEGEKAHLVPQGIVHTSREAFDDFDQDRTAPPGQSRLRSSFPET